MTEEELKTHLQSEYRDKGGVIGICGLPGSGKSTLAKKLSNVFEGRSLALPLDDFCIAATPVRKSFLKKALEQKDKVRLTALARPVNADENPYANPVSWYDWAAAGDALQHLRAGIPITRENAWNQATGLCDKTATYPSKGALGIYFVDCVYLFETPLREQIDRFVLIEMSPDKSFEREKLRDAHRNDPVYADYKRMVTDFYCVPYLARYRADMDFIVV